MTPEKRLAPLTNWNAEVDDNGKVLKYFIESEVEEYAVRYEINRKGQKWYPKITADEHITYQRLSGFDTAEDALAAMMKRCNMM